STLILALLEHNPATIVIDALDECIPACRYEILKTLDNIIQKSASLVKVFVSSRDDNDIVCRLNDSPNVIIHASDNGKDIERFIHFEVEKGIKDKRMLRGDISDELKNRIITTLAKGAKGMFRWVSLQIQNLCDAQRIKHEEELIQELGRLPKTLRELYDIIFKRIQASGEKSQVIAERALKWLLCAQRPLKSLEFIAAVDLHGQYPKKSSDILLDMCCNLVVLDVELDVFRFAHLSVREYIEDLDEYTNIEIHKLAAERCIDVYVYKTFKTFTTEQNNVLTPYATLYWPVHCQYIKYHLTDKLKGKIRQFTLQDGGVSPLFLNWISAMRKLPHKQLNWEGPLTRKLKTVFSFPHTPPFLACCFGLFSSVDDLTTLKNVNWNQRNHDGRTGLQVAAEGGHIEMVEKLLAAGADVNAAAGRYGGRTALQAAAEGGHIEVVEKLLAAGADVNAAAGYEGRTGLQAAAVGGHIEVVEKLLATGADVNAAAAAANEGQTALQAAAAGGYIEVAEKLLAAGADVNASGGGGSRERTVLQAAAEGGHIEVVEKLLAAGADVNAAVDDYGGRTALQAAAEGGHVEVVEKLLAAGADVNATVDYGGRTALQAAEEGGHIEVVEKLKIANTRLEV
ncbi:MAG: hypothetical protein MMC33_010843, partial [Icmadophila ericetorum]|nr:hypothetical protein [Icmadophila ericetorum]